jgi:hypothetical protein
MMVGPLESIISQCFTDVPIEKGIHRLVGNRSVAVMYQIINGSHNRKTLQDIEEVWVFGSSEAVAENPDPDIRQDSSKIHAMTESANDLLHLRNNTSDAGTESPNEPEKLNPPPIAVAIKDAAAYPWFNPESDEGYWADKLIGNTNVAVRRQAITELQRIGSDAALAAIATVLGDNDVELRRHAVESLGRIENDTALQLLGQALLGDRDPSVRLEAIQSFANLNDEVSRAFLNTALKDNDEQVRALAKQALGGR